MAVAFEIPNINHGLKKGQGIMKLWERGIALEFEVEDAFLGIVKSGVKNVQIPYEDLESIIFEKGWFGAKIKLQGISMQAFREVPGTEVAMCELKIKRADREEAQSLVSHARMQLSEYKLRQLDDD